MQADFNPRGVKLIVGLGNPGTEYKNTYHNTGVLMIEYLKEIWGAKEEGIKNKPFLIYKSWENPALVRLLTFMNNSGSGTLSAMQQLKIKNPEEILVVHDDSDIGIGKYKLAFGGSSAGHKGIASEIQRLGTENFWRLKIGIRDPNQEIHEKAGEFVLQKMSPADKKILTGVFEEIAAKIFKI